MIAIPLNFRGIVSVSVVMIGLTLFYIILNIKEKHEYEKTTGKITYLNNQLGELPISNFGKYRYLIIDGYQYPFEIFVGKDSGDFKPKFEQLDNLKVGEVITVYFYQTVDTDEEGINRFIQFIDKENISFYERGNSNITLGIVLILICLLMIIGAIVLRNMKKIE